MTGLEILGLVGLFALISVIPIGRRLGSNGEATVARQFIKFIETNELGTDI